MTLRSARDVNFEFGSLFFLKVLLQHAGAIRPAKLFSPRDQGPIAGDFVVLDGLSRRDQRCVEHFFVVNFTGDFVSLFDMPSIAGHSTPFASTPCILKTCSSRLT